MKPRRTSTAQGFEAIPVVYSLHEARDQFFIHKQNSVRCLRKSDCTEKLCADYAQAKIFYCNKPDTWMMEHFGTVTP